MMKKLMLLPFLLCLYMQTFTQATDRFWWHQDGVKAQWYEQQDVIAFKTKDNEGFLQPNLIGIQSVSQERNWHGIHIVKLLPGVGGTPSVPQLKIMIEGRQDFDSYLQPITKDPSSLYGEDKWRLVDDIIQVVFKDPAISFLEVRNFMSRWELTPHVLPDTTLPNSISWPYQFKNIHPLRYSSRWTIDIARDIMEQDNALVQFAEPNIINLFESASWDPNYDDAWHIHNTGQALNNNTNGTADADCDITQAWDRGFTGNGIHIAVMDKGGFSPDHPDMVGAYAHTFNAKDTLPFTAWRANWNWFDSHGEASAGLIASRKDNQIGGVGVAPNAEIGAYLFDGSPAQAARCLMDIYLEPNGIAYPIVSLGWASYLSSTEGMQCFKIVLDQLILNGNQGQGTLVFAASGNRGDQTALYPAAFPNVVAVGATTPDDQVKVLADTWQPTGSASDWASSQGSHLDFAAPGAYLTSHDLHGTYSGTNLGQNAGDYMTFHGTSGATAIAAGIAALVMEADPSLTPLGPQSVYSTMALSAETVGGYDYNYDPQQPGRSLETGHGRLNAHTAVNLVSLPDPHDPSLTPFQLAYHSNGEDRIYYDITQINGPVYLLINNLQGQVLARIQLPKGAAWMTLDKKTLSGGLYLLHLDQGGKTISPAKKWVLR